MDDVPLLAAEPLRSTARSDVEKGPQVFAAKYCGMPVNLANVIIMGVAFLLIFLAFNTTQNFLTIANGSLGFWSLAVLYFFFSISTFVAPAIVASLKLRPSIVIGAITYVLFLAATIKPTPAVLLPAAGIIGIGASIMWTAQGTYLVNCCTPATLGKYSGIFWALFQSNAIVGNLLIAVLLHYDISFTTIAIIFTFVSVMGTLLLLLLRRANKSEDVQPVTKTSPLPPKALLYVTFKLFRDARFQYLMPLLLYSGASQSFFYGVFTKYMGEDWTGFVMATFGLAEVIGSMVNGHISDKYGRRVGILIMFVCELLAFGLAFRAKVGEPYMYFAALFAFGLGDSALNTNAYATLGVVFSGNTDAAFSGLKFFQSVGTGAPYVYSIFLSKDHVEFIAVALLFIATFTFVRLCNFCRVDAISGGAINNGKPIEIS